ncbi:AAA family ATPase [Alteromonas pelagimontana]|uniref:AAA family ATPase n=1 Tax=Alteromonas pelagimontana TaxID=1858656 RepID=A0A6M4MGE8_9ALTE|nr:AAA family ATPase [Alteromonas pelagimontana]QJR82264.1 AAA family ATPase [Alteromonas pelagimontana]
MIEQKKAPAVTEAMQNNINTSTFNIPLCSGFGQFHSTKNKLEPKAYKAITLQQIVDMLARPPSRAKEHGQWAIFSDLASRDVIEQRNTGAFYALWADIDDTGDKTFTDMFSLAYGALSVDLIAYTSRSATEAKQKSRLIVPLAHSVNGRDFEIMQKILNDKLEAAGVIPDRKTETANQICYLPNKGEFYDFMDNFFTGLLSVDSWGDEFHAEMQTLEAAEYTRKERLEQSKRKAYERMSSSGKSPIDAYKAAYSPLDLLELYGGKVRGERAVSPLSESGNAQIVIKPDGALLSHHGSDDEAGLGKRTPQGKRLIDAWDLFKFFEHGNDETAALKAAGVMFTDENGVSISKRNQRDYMEAQSATPEALEAVTVIFDNEAPPSQLKQPPKPTFDFTKFALNGSSATMKAQMLDDRYVLDGLAILGQATVFYAKPNSGKTLLTLHLICDGIKRGEVDGSDVFYINADDDLKGLVTKLEIAEQHGFYLIGPSFKDFRINDFASYIAAMIKADDCKGKVIILDTLKKFTNIMDKKMASDFGKYMRGFVSKGGTMILLAHTNKNRDLEGKVVFSGTSDIVDDVDCAYTIDVTESNELSKTVLFENIKSRGDVEQEVAYSYANDITGATGGYLALLNSVHKVSTADAEEAKQQRGIMDQLEKNALIIEAIQEALAGGEMKKTDLIEEANKLSGISKERVSKTLNAHTGKDWSKGHRWTRRKGEKHSFFFRALHCTDQTFGLYDKLSNGD